MKALHVVIASLALTSSIRGQGTFIYDQQSADESAGGGTFVNIQSSQLLGQSFTPTNSSVGFVRLWLGDQSINGSGATAYVNLRSNSISGPILAQSTSVFMPDGFGISSGGFTNFLFSIPVSVVPGLTYFFQPVLQSGDTSWAAVKYHYDYPGGMAYINGVADFSFNSLWFREGIVVPEPSSLSLILLGAGMFIYRRHLAGKRLWEKLVSAE